MGEAWPGFCSTRAVWVPDRGPWGVPGSAHPWGAGAQGQPRRGLAVARGVRPPRRTSNGEEVAPWQEGGHRGPAGQETAGPRSVTQELCSCLLLWERRVPPSRGSRGNPPWHTACGASQTQLLSYQRRFIIAVGFSFSARVPAHGDVWSLWALFGGSRPWRSLNPPPRKGCGAGWGVMTDSLEPHLQSVPPPAACGKSHPLPVTLPPPLSFQGALSIRKRVS